jgi:hypothetical protein
MTNDDDDGDGGDDDAAAAKAARKAEESARRRKARRRSTGSTAFGRAGDEDGRNHDGIPSAGAAAGREVLAAAEENGESMAIGGRKVVADRWIPCATHDVLSTLE